MGLGNSSRIISIHILDDDSLLNIFCLYRPYFLGEDSKDLRRLQGGWSRDEGWWYRLAHVCQRWRNLIFGSASYLRLSLVCANGTPVEKMLAHSLPFPLTVDYDERGTTPDDEKGILLALEQRHRVRHLRLNFPVQNLRNLIMAIDEEFPILEYLIVIPSESAEDVEGAALMLPETFQAPNLRHLTLYNFACPIRPRLHPTAANLITLFLTIDRPSTYFQPNILLQWISFMPQLETLVIMFTFPVPKRDVKRQLTNTPITGHVTLPNLRVLSLQGASSAYSEAIVRQISAPRIENLVIHFFNQLTFSVPHLAQFMNTVENIRFDHARISFSSSEIEVVLEFPGFRTFPFRIIVGCEHYDWQVSFVVQICNALGQKFSAARHLTLKCYLDYQSSEERHGIDDRIEWREILRSFSNVKTLHIHGLVEELSRCLRLEDGELPLELLPELQELQVADPLRRASAFTSFIDARQNAGRPVTLTLFA